MRKKRLLCLLLALGMLLSLLGCSGTAADADSNQIYDELADYYQQKNMTRMSPSAPLPCPIFRA